VTGTSAIQWLSFQKRRPKIKTSPRGIEARQCAVDEQWNSGRILCTPPRWEKQCLLHTTVFLEFFLF
jgi:hypothetical protein